MSGFEWWWLIPLICLTMMLLCVFGWGRRGGMCCGGTKDRGYPAVKDHADDKRE